MKKAKMGTFFEPSVNRVSSGAAEDIEIPEFFKMEIEVRYSVLLDSLKKSFLFDESEKGVMIAATSDDITNELGKISFTLFSHGVCYEENYKGFADLVKSAEPEVLRQRYEGAGKILDISHKRMEELIASEPRDMADLANWTKHNFTEGITYLHNDSDMSEERGIENFEIMERMFTIVSISLFRVGVLAARTRNEVNDLREIWEASSLKGDGDA